MIGLVLFSHVFHTLFMNHQELSSIECFIPISHTASYNSCIHSCVHLLCLNMNVIIQIFIVSSVQLSFPYLFLDAHLILHSSWTQSLTIILQSPPKSFLPKRNASNSICDLSLRGYPSFSRPFPLITAILGHRQILFQFFVFKSLFCL